MAETFADILLSTRFCRRLLLHSLEGCNHRNLNKKGRQHSRTQAHSQKMRKTLKSVRMTGQMILLVYSATMEVHS